MNVNKSNNKSVLSIYFIFILLMICVVSLKKNVHVDEIYSYGLSNSNASTICLSFENGIKYEPSVLPYMNYTTVSKGERFNYDNVWQKQTSDVHPPFYYAILHTICSFFPGVYSKWFAGVINIVFAILTLYVFRKLINCFVYDEKVINIMSVTFILSSGILSSISFFRMYIMAMFFVTLYTFLFIYAVGKTELSVKFWIVLPFSAILGVLTHYYCIIYLVSICVVFGVYLLRNKRWKETGLFVGIMAFSALVSLSIFPAMTKHMFAGGRGTQAIDNLSKTSLSEYWDRIKSFYGFIDNQVLGGAIWLHYHFCDICYYIM